MMISSSLVFQLAYYAICLIIIAFLIYVIVAIPTYRYYAIAGVALIIIIRFRLWRFTPCERASVKRQVTEALEETTAVQIETIKNLEEANRKLREERDGLERELRRLGGGGGGSLLPSRSPSCYSLNKGRKGSTTTYPRNAAMVRIAAAIARGADIGAAVQAAHADHQGKEEGDAARRRGGQRRGEADRNGSAGTAADAVVPSVVSPSFLSSHQEGRKHKNISTNLAIKNAAQNQYNESIRNAAMSELQQQRLALQQQAATAAAAAVGEKQPPQAQVAAAGGSAIPSGPALEQPAASSSQGARKGIAAYPSSSNGRGGKSNALPYPSCPPSPSSTPSLLPIVGPSSQIQDKHAGPYGFGDGTGRSPRGGGFAAKDDDEGAAAAAADRASRNSNGFFSRMPSFQKKDTNAATTPRTYDDSHVGNTKTHDPDNIVGGGERWGGNAALPRDNRSRSGQRQQPNENSSGSNYAAPSPSHHLPLQALQDQQHRPQRSMSIASSASAQHQFHQFRQEDYREAIPSPFHSQQQQQQQQVVVSPRLQHLLARSMNFGGNSSRGQDFVVGGGGGERGGGSQQQYEDGMNISIASRSSGAAANSVSAAGMLGRSFSSQQQQNATQTQQHQTQQKGQPQTVRRSSPPCNDDDDDDAFMTPRGGRRAGGGGGANNNNDRNLNPHAGDGQTAVWVQSRPASPSTSLQSLHQHQQYDHHHPTMSGQNNTTSSSRSPRHGNGVVHNYYADPLPPQQQHRSASPASTAFAAQQQQQLPQPPFSSAYAYAFQSQEHKKDPRQHQQQDDCGNRAPYGQRG